MITTEDEDPMRTSVNSINFINRFLYDEEATEGERERRMGRISARGS
jgi:hypothetical protein